VTTSRVTVAGEALAVGDALLVLVLVLGDADVSLGVGLEGVGVLVDGDDDGDGVADDAVALGLADELVGVATGELLAQAARPSATTTAPTDTRALVPAVAADMATSPGRSGRTAGPSTVVVNLRRAVARDGDGRAGEPRQEVTSRVVRRAQASRPNTTA
jgi:hypothetical protein